MPAFESWLRPTPEGLFCEAGGFFIDPVSAVERAVITHGHSDHARRGHGAVLATPETIDIMRLRMGSDCAGSFQPCSYRQPLRIRDVEVELVPAGHILGAAQVVLRYGGQTAVVSGDYKRATDPTCASFELVRCDLFITEATFGLPVFTHGDVNLEVAKLLRSLQDFPERTHQVGVYGLGKCQRLIALMRQQGFDRPIWLHSALRSVTDYYVSKGIALGPVPSVADAPGNLAGEVVLSPPSALGDRWSRRFADPLAGFASGWMRIRGRARQRGIELPLVISDHVDWPAILDTIIETGAQEIWVTHGREEAIVHQCTKMGLKARALALVGLEEEGE